MTLESLSNIELYYCPSEKISSDRIVIEGEEVKHIYQVMRHRNGEIISVTDGIGNLFKCEIISADRNSVICKILNTKSEISGKNQHSFYIPVIRDSERFEFALEKCTELGIRDFHIYSAEKSVKKNINIKRLEKIVLSAMKQSLRLYLPLLNTSVNLMNDKMEGSLIVLDQHAEESIETIDYSADHKFNFIFGPEGSFSKTELDFFKLRNAKFVHLGAKRLRTETAIVMTASIISSQSFRK